MNKICTSIEQSKKLIKLGINVNTADMCYDWSVIGKEYSTVAQCRKYIDDELPAWSLSALLELIPDMIEDYILRIDKVDGEYYIWYDKISEGWSDNMAHPSSENFIDAAFEMVVWLKENNKI